MPNPFQMDIILKYFPQLKQEQLTLLKTHHDFFLEWNQKINLISRKESEEGYWEKHILHSLALAFVQPLRPQSEVLDIGTGGGFPGLPLAILYPDTNFTLVDSIGKKILVVNDLVDQLGLKNVTAIHGRAENCAGYFDFILTRAVAPMAELVQWSKGKISQNNFHELPNGILAWKGGDLKQELSEVKGKKKIFPLKDYFSEEFFETKAIVYQPLN